MGRIFLTLGLLGLLGCGDGGGAAADVHGTWVSSTVSLSLDQDAGAYTLMRLERISSRTANAQVELGKLTPGETLSFVPQQSSCSLPSPWTAAFSRTGDSLSIALPSGQADLMLDTSSPNDSLAVGCFQADGTFVGSTIGP